MATLTRSRSSYVLRHVARSIERDYQNQSWSGLAAGIKAAAKVGIKTAYLGGGLFAFEDTTPHP